MKPVIGFLALILVAIVVWTPVRTLLFGGKFCYGNTPKGEWVGTLDITGGYEPKTMGDTPGPHAHAVLYFNLDVTDRFENQYGGPGKLFIQGEKTVRDISIKQFWLSDDGHASVYLVSKPHLVDRFKGHYANNALTLSQPDPDDLQFQGTFHHGTKQDYTNLLQTLK